jgi:putative ABC transport system permease protein
VTGLFRYVSLRHLRHAVGRMLLVLATVTLAVALRVCIRATSENAERALIGAVEHTVGHAQLQVRALDESGIPDSLLERVRGLEGVAEASAVIDAHARLGGQSGKALVILGLDVLDPATRTFYDSALQGDVVDDPVMFVAQPDSLAVDAEFASRNGVRLGSQLSLVTVHGRRDFVVRGLLRAGDLGGALGGNVGLMDINAAQRAFGKVGRVDRIDLRLADGVDTAVTAPRLRELVGGAAAVERPGTRGANVEQMLLSFRLMTIFLRVIALFAAGFLVFGMTSIAVVQRRREIAVLRAIGTTRGQAAALFVGEAALLAAVGALVGLGVGMWMARALSQAFTSLIEANFLVQLDVGRPSFSAGALLSAFAVGVAAAILASLLAAQQAAGVPITAALKALPPPGPGRELRRKRLALALGLAVVSIIAVLAQMRSGTFLVGGAADPLIVLSAFLATPYLIGVLAPALIRPGLVLCGTPALLALRNVTRHGERVAAPVTILTIGLHLLITVGAIAASFESSVLAWARQAWKVDLGVTNVGSSGPLSNAPMDEAFGEELRVVPGVERVQAFRMNRVQFRGAEVGLQPWAHATPPTADDVGRFTFVRGDASWALGKLSAGAFALVSENFSVHFGLGVGDTLELPTSRGPARFEIVGVVIDYGSTAGSIIISRNQYERQWQDPVVDLFEVSLARGSSEEAVRDAIERRFDVTVYTIGQRLKETCLLLHRAFFPLRAVEFVVLSIGLLSLLNALIVSLVDRVRELGVLRAMGASTRQLVAMIVLESMAASTMASVLGIALGFYGSYSWIRVHVPAATGWIVHYTFPWETLLAAVAAAFTLAIAAAVYPARLAARIPVLDAITVE